MNEVQQNALKIRADLRQKCRTDLLRLCKVLGYMDVSEKVHGPILEVLPKFPGGEDTEKGYKPFREI
jgi:hypothetical protein